MMAGRKSNAQKAAEAEERRQEIADAVKAGLAGVKAEMRAELEQEIADQLGAARGIAPDDLDEPGSEDGQGVLNLAKPATQEGNKAFASTLALAIANLSAQGTGKQAYIPPEVLEAQANARVRMMELLVKARVEGKHDRSLIPTYRVTKPCFFNSTKIEPQWHDAATKSMKDTEIYWDEVPNQDLEPINEAAVQVFSEFLNSIGEAPVSKGEADVQWVRSDKRLYKGMTNEQRASVQGTSTDIRIEGRGAPTTGKREHILGSVAAPAVVR